MVTIILNSIFLAIYDYSDQKDVTYRNYVCNQASLVFSIIFSIEMVLNIIAYGLVFHRSSYLRNKSNWLDIFVVVFGWLELLPSIPNLKGIRTLRMLRPLRSIKFLPNLKSQVVSLMTAVGKLLNVIVFQFFLFFIFGILGMQIF